MNQTIINLKSSSNQILPELLGHSGAFELRPFDSLIV